MKAVRIHSYGSAINLKMEETPKPEITANEVLVKIHDAGVNPVDWKIRAGFMKAWMPATFPLTMGQDFSGEIVAVGQNIHNFSIGDRVFGFAKGTYAEYAAVSENEITKIPKSMDFGSAASLPTPGLTAYQIIIDKIKAHKGQKILIHGAAGSVGSLAVQMAKSLGAEVIANAAGKDEKYLKTIGASLFIDYKTQRFEEMARDVDVVVDLVGGDTLARSYQCVKKGGLIITSVGPVDEENAKKAGVQIIQFVMEQKAEDLQKIAMLFEQGKLKTRLGNLMPLEKAREAQEINETGQSHAKIILQVTK